MLSGPLPDLGAVAGLTQLNLTGNQLCLPGGLDPGRLARRRGRSRACPESSSLRRRRDGRTPTQTPTSGPTPTPTQTPTPGPTPTPTATAGETSETTSAAERAALVALYRATNGASWTRNDNWLSGAPVGSWYGVSTGRRRPRDAVVSRTQRIERFDSRSERARQPG